MIPSGNPIIVAADELPSDSRNVLCWGPEKRAFVGFYWRSEKLWYRRKGGKRKQDAVEVVYWCELDGAELR